jgi:anti-sigma-K factor RskA
MSPLPPEDDPDLLAAEFVLGVLSPQDRAAAEVRIKQDRSFAAAVSAWEARLSGLNDSFPEVPAPDLMPRIEDRLFGKPVPKPPFWRNWIAGAASAAALGAAVLLLVPETVFTPDQPLVTLSGDTQALRYDVALEGETLRISRVAGPEAEAGTVHELWLIAGDAAPVSLGLITGDSLSLGAPLLSAGMVLAISLEPTGGSPTGAPTGPVLVTGVIAGG